MFDYLKSRWQSLIFRLLFYFLLSIMALALVLAISFTQRIKPHLQNEILPNVERYIGYLIDDIGYPPDTAVAQRLADELPFELRIEGKGLEWSSTPRLGSFSRYEFDPAPGPYKGVYIGHHRRDEFLLIERRGYGYLFALDRKFRRGTERRHGLLFIALGTIFFVLYLVIRRMFRPVAAISEQVKKIGEGDLEQTVPARGKGELAQRAQGINRMSAQIKSMLEGKSAMLLAISHELRSPLTRMRVNLELLDVSDIQQKLIDDIREMERLVAAILESEKLGSGHAPLNRLRCRVDELVDEVLLAHPQRARIEADLAEIEAEIDPMRFSLLVKNLVDNACDHAGEAAVELRLVREGNELMFEVRDQGPGIPADEIPRLGEAFYRPDSARARETGGYGLGLYLCQLIVTAHGGRMAIESEPGKGTKVIVRLPLDKS